MATYPHAPGHKAGDTSAQAARASRRHAESLRLHVLDALVNYGPMSADQCAVRLRRSVLAIRPRFSELVAQGKIEKTTARVRNSSGHTAVIWRKATA